MGVTNDTMGQFLFFKSFYELPRMTPNVLNISDAAL